MKYWIFVLSLLLAGCSPHFYRARSIPLRCTDLCVNVEQSFESDSVCPGEYPNERWWTFFQDPQLASLIEMSLASHPDIKIAQARILMAHDEALESRSTLLPHFSLFGNIWREKLSLFGSRTQATPDLEYITETTTLLNSVSYELDIWGKNRNLYYAAIDEMVARIADYEEANLVLSTTIASVYFDLQWKLDLLRIAKERLKAREEVYALLKQRFDNGVIDQFELYETSTEVELLRDQVIHLEGLTEIDRHALAALVANPACLDLVVEPAAIFDSPLPLPSTLPLDLLARRPDITAQVWRIEASCLEVKAAKANFLPRIDLIAYIGYGSFKLAEMFTNQTLTWIGEAIGSLPLFTACRLEAQLGITREALEIAIETYNQLVLNAVQEVSDSMTQLTTADARIKALERSIEDARALYSLTFQRYENKIADRIAVLNAVENLLSQEELEVTVQLARFQGAVSLIKAIGGGYYDCSCP